MSFRWLPYEERAAAWNMAVDEAILEAHLQGRVPVTLRFYGWSPPAVSLGYAQRLPASVIEKIRARGFDVVRRPTGGRAVLHQGDLTYSFIGSSQSCEADCPDLSNPTVNPGGSATALLPASVSQSYLQICEGLLAGLRNLGLQAEIGRGRNPYNRFEDCFQTTTNADLQIDGLKVVGSAQLRRKHAVLQHGSILLHQEQALLPDLLAAAPEKTVAVLNGTTEGAVKSNVRHCNIFDLIEARPMVEIERAFLDGFKVATGEEFLEQPLTEFEQEVAAQLLNKYSRL